MTSTKTLMPVDYFSLPFCRPPGRPKKMDHENLGEFLTGSRIERSPYRLKMNTDMYCEQVCISNVGRAEQISVRPNKVVRAISENYHNNWIVDNLSAACEVEDDTTITRSYSKGFPVGFVTSDTKKAYIHNHVNIQIMYHPVETEVDKYRIVRFIVEPLSINHEFEPIVDDDNTNDETSNTIAKILNPIPSCDLTREKNLHTAYYMTNDSGREYQLASGNVLFTYDVTWVENAALNWASRWEIYISMDETFPGHLWLRALISLFSVFVFSAVIAAILVRNLRRDFARYNKLPTDEEKEKAIDEFGWKLVQGDVFRPPSFAPLLLSVACGMGAQILCVSFLAVIFAAMGFLSPENRAENRAALVIAFLLLYPLTGCVAGYVTARLYKTFKGTSCQWANVLTALGFPVITFVFFFLRDLLALAQGITDAFPFKTMIVLLVLWFGMSTPLVFLGAYFGDKQDVIEFPVETTSIPREIPHQRDLGFPLTPVIGFLGLCFGIPTPVVILGVYFGYKMRSNWVDTTTTTPREIPVVPDLPCLVNPLIVVIGAILPLGACFVNLSTILMSIWMFQRYYVIGVMVLLWFLLVVTSAEITVLFCYIQLCSENYHWWWRSFCTAGCAALFLIFYSIDFFRLLETSSFSAYVLYFGYMGLVSLALFLMTGFVGLASSLWFTKTIFASLKNIYMT